MDRYRTRVGLHYKTPTATSGRRLLRAGHDDGTGRPGCRPVYSLRVVSPALNQISGRKEDPNVSFRFDFDSGRKEAKP
jgi:hypothetical protein